MSKLTVVLFCVSVFSCHECFAEDKHIPLTDDKIITNTNNVLRFAVKQWTNTEDLAYLASGRHVTKPIVSGRLVYKDGDNTYAVGFFSAEFDDSDIGVKVLLLSIGEDEKGKNFQLDNRDARYVTASKKNPKVVGLFATIKKEIEKIKQ